MQPTLSIGISARNCSGSKEKLVALAYTLCRSSNSPQSLAAAIWEIHCCSDNELQGGCSSVAMFSIKGKEPTMRAAFCRFLEVFSTEASVRGGAARWPISTSPERTKARCSDQASG